MKRTEPRTTLLLVLVTAALWFGGCSPMPELSDVTAERAYDIGAAAMASEDYMIAIEAFRRVTDDHPLAPEADDALLGLADAHRAIREYALAEHGYMRLMEDYPDSPLVPEAQYKLGLTFYEQSLPATLDQSMTRRALARLNRFLAAYPGSEFSDDAEELKAELRSRLAEKLFLSAELYLQLGDLDAAGIYFDQVVEEYPDTPWAPRSLRVWESNLREAGRTAEADEVQARRERLFPASTEEARPAGSGDEAGQ